MTGDDATLAFGALADRTRLAMIRVLVAAGHAGVSAGEVARAVGASASRASFHLAALERAGLIGAERVSRHVVYRADMTRLGALAGFLVNDCCAGDPRVRTCCAPPSGGAADHPRRHGSA